MYRYRSADRPGRRPLGCRHGMYPVSQDGRLDNPGRYGRRELRRPTAQYRFSLSRQLCRHTRLASCGFLRRRHGMVAFPHLRGSRLPPLKQRPLSRPDFGSADCVRPHYTFDLGRKRRHPLRARLPCRNCRTHRRPRYRPGPRRTTQRGQLRAALRPGGSKRPGSPRLTQEKATRYAGKPDRSKFSTRKRLPARHVREADEESRHLGASSIL